MPVPYPLDSWSLKRGKWDWPDWFLLGKSMLSVPHHVAILKVFKIWFNLIWFNNLFQYLSSYWKQSDCFSFLSNCCFPFVRSDAVCALLSQSSSFSLNSQWTSITSLYTVQWPPPGLVNLRTSNLLTQFCLPFFFPMAVQYLRRYVVLFFCASDLLPVLKVCVCCKEIALWSVRTVTLKMLYLDALWLATVIKVNLTVNQAFKKV